MFPVQISVIKAWQRQAGRYKVPGGAGVAAGPSWCFFFFFLVRV
jgi:hypothetical protein